MDKGRDEKCDETPPLQGTNQEGLSDNMKAKRAALVLSRTCDRMLQLHPGCQSEFMAAKTVVMSPAFLEAVEREMAGTGPLSLAVQETGQETETETHPVQETQQPK